MPRYLQAILACLPYVAPGLLVQVWPRQEGGAMTVVRRGKSAAADKGR
ncbi:MAG: hypothetical protein HYY13_13605 [Nitrospirae bacterium]|nr:hypothetical protein [Nitrospirota bacterium]